MITIRLIFSRKNFIFFFSRLLKSIFLSRKSDWRAKRFGGHDKHFINFPGATSRKTYDVAMQLILSQRASSYFQLIKIDRLLYCVHQVCFTEVRVAGASGKKWTVKKFTKCLPPSACTPSMHYCHLSVARGKILTSCNKDA